MASVTERRVASLLTIAECDGLGFFDGEFLRPLAGAFVGAVAEGGSASFAAGAVEVVAWLEFCNCGGEFGHFDYEFASEGDIPSSISATRAGPR